jgi:two-component system response regulator PilR (NtrC family)
LTLLAYPFPGNVRELENVLERAVTLSATGTIRDTDLNLRPVDESTVSHIATATNLDNQVEGVQRQAIIEALKKTRYNKTAAAKLLGLSLRQLRYRIAKLGIE